MANMPGFAEACQLSHDHRLLECVGVHLNLGEGFPLTDAMRASSKFCNGEGQLRITSSRFTTFLSGNQQRILADEVRSQIAACRRMGITPTHLDSHRHLHVQWAILNVVVAVAREQGIPYVRIPRNCGPGIGPATNVYKTLVIRKIDGAGLRRTRFFGSLSDYLWLKNEGRLNESMEVMIHPRYLASGVLCNYPHPTPLSRDMLAIDSYQGSPASKPESSGKREEAKAASAASHRAMNLQNKGFIVTAVMAGLMFPGVALAEDSSTAALSTESAAKAVAAGFGYGREMR
jgi:predicted glycoside hydrolase/deacetylase ChbG (UPF0249 family)